MRRILAGAILAAVVAGTASAQAPGAAAPIVAHFRAYRAALDAGDLATAETEAEAALAASTERDGDGGRTAVLAMNLAQVRLDRGRSREAYEPAMRAFNVMSANDAVSGLDPLVVRLALGRAELEAVGAAGEQRLLAGLSEAERRPDAIGAAHAAAAALGMWAVAERKYATARRAWEFAGGFAAGSPAGATFARAEARVGAATAIVLFNMEHESPSSLDTHIPRQRDYTAAEAALVEAIELLEPMAHANAPIDGLTRPQSLYANARAWRALIHARLGSGIERQRLIAAGREALGATRTAQAEASRPECAIALTAEPKPQFPPGAQMALSVGAVVMRIVWDEGGRPVDVRVASAVPARWFADAVSAVAPQWRAERAPDNPAGCAMPRVAFVTTIFTYR